jgi:uncharacterized membrane protein
MILTIIGLALNTLGAILLVFFPPSMQRFTTDGAPEVPWIGNQTPLGRFRGRWQRTLSVVGLLLLAMGFVVQIVGEYIPAQRAAPLQKYLRCSFTGDDHQTHERAFVFADGGNGLVGPTNDAWKITVNTPIRIVAEQDEVLAGRLIHTELLTIDRVSGASSMVRLANADKKLPEGTPPLPAGTRLGESEMIGRCELAGHRAIE